MINTKNKAKSRLRALMMAANEIKVDGNELVQILTLSKKEILELKDPFGCGDSPLFTYPFFGEEQIVNLQIPTGTLENVLESLEIVFCICNQVSKQDSRNKVEQDGSQTTNCYLGINHEGILSDARNKIKETLIEMVGDFFKIKFFDCWEEFQAVFKQESSTELQEERDDREGNVKVLQGMSRAATPIDPSDPKWSIYLQFNSENSTSVTGLLTAYNYFKFPEGTRVRISQVLILPRYQGHRMGGQLYRSVTELLRNDPERECVEICVEDPTDSFERIRGLIDYKECIKRDLFNSQDLNDKCIIDKMKSDLLFTQEQSERLLLLNKSIHRSSGPGGFKRLKSNNSELVHLRQEIKRWLLRKFRKELPEKGNERILKLAELYETELEVFIEPLIENLKQ